MSSSTLMVKANFSHFNSAQQQYHPLALYRWALITIIVNVISGNYDYFFFEKAGISRNPNNLKMSYFPFSDKNKLSCLPKNAIQQTTVVLRSCLYVFLGLIYYKGGHVWFFGWLDSILDTPPAACSFTASCLYFHSYYMCNKNTLFRQKRKKYQDYIYDRA